MLAWAVSYLVLAAAKGADDPQTDLSPKEVEVWQRLQKGFATLQLGGVAVGSAALIDSSGLFMTHEAAVGGEAPENSGLDGTLSNGRTLKFSVISKDSLTKLVLLQAREWKAEYGTPIRVPEGDEVGHGMVFAVLPTGPIRAAFTKLNFPGIVLAERRVIPLNEVQFESQPGGCAGALLVDEDGELLGVLNATLARGGVMDSAINLGARNQNGGLVPLNGQGQHGPTYVPQPIGGSGVRNRPMGPSDLVVAYTAGVVVLKKVVDGFRSPTHRVAYPSIGLLCKDFPPGGALVQAVQPESPADQAGIRPGDVLLQVAGVQIRNQVDFSLVMLKQTAGDTIVVQFKRRTRQLFEPVVVGHS